MTLTPHPCLTPRKKELKSWGFHWAPHPSHHFSSNSFLLEDLQHVDLFHRMGAVQLAFGIFIHYFMQQPSCLLWCTPPSSTFIKFPVSFDSSFLQVFGHLLGSRSFDSPKKLLAHKQVILLIAFGNIGVISITTITPTTYLGSWALVVSIIATRFMVDQPPFLLEA